MFEKNKYTFYPFLNYHSLKLLIIIQKYTTFKKKITFKKSSDFFQVHGLRTTGPIVILLRRSPARTIPLVVRRVYKEGTISLGRVILGSSTSLLVGETYSRIGPLRSHGNLQSYWTTARLWKLTVLLDYYEAMGTYGRIGLLRSY